MTAERGLSRAKLRLGLVEPRADGTGKVSNGISRDIDAVMFDFGGVLADGPFDGFARYEKEHGLPDGFVRRLNAADHHTNAWARLERGEIALDVFYEQFEDEARRAGGTVDARALIACLGGDLRPAMLAAVGRCREHFRTGLLTNNFVQVDGEGALGGVLELFDTIVESSVIGVRKPDPRFYVIACERLGVEPCRSVFLDDLGINLKPARELGMRTIKVTDLDEALTELEEVLGLPLR